MAIRQWYNKRPIFMARTLFVVATPIGNLEDITARALRVLREVQLIAAEDTRRTARLLAHYGILTPTTSLHEHNERQKSAGLIERLQRGDDIALVSDAGTPTISDPGQQLIREALAAGLRVQPVPGPSAILAALAVSGFPTDAFTFLGFPPTRGKDRTEWFERLRAAGGTVVFFESPHRIRATLEQLIRSVGDRPLFLAREVTKLHEELVIRPISEVLGGLGSPRGEFTAVLDVGHSTDTPPAVPDLGAAMAAEFTQLTKSMGLTRRQAIARISRSHGVPANVLYDALERLKKSVD